MSDCLILNAVSCATPVCSKAMYQMFKFIEDARAIHHDKLYGLSSYITTARRPCLWLWFSLFLKFSSRGLVLFLVLKHAHRTVSRNSYRCKCKISFWIVLKQSLLDLQGLLLTIWIPKPSISLNVCLPIILVGSFSFLLFSVALWMHSV